MKKPLIGTTWETAAWKTASRILIAYKSGNSDINRLLVGIGNPHGLTITNVAVVIIDLSGNHRAGSQSAPIILRGEQRQLVCSLLRRPKYIGIHRFQHRVVTCAGRCRSCYYIKA
jgi:hypothetical protein